MLKSYKAKFETKQDNEGGFLSNKYSLVAEFDFSQDAARKAEEQEIAKIICDKSDRSLIKYLQGKNLQLRDSSNSNYHLKIYDDMTKGDLILKPNPKNLRLKLKFNVESRNGPLQLEKIIDLEELDEFVIKNMAYTEF